MKTLGMLAWLGLKKMKEIMKPVKTMVNKNQFSWRTECPRVLVAVKQVLGALAPGGCCKGEKDKVPDACRRCRRNGTECTSYLAMLWKEEVSSLMHSKWYV